LRNRLPELIGLGPDFVTVTYGALGSTRERTLELACLIRTFGKEVAHHLTCLAASRSEIDGILEGIRECGITNIVALRGDPPKGESEFRPPEGGFRYASELVEHIRGHGDFGIAVAGYPEKHVEAPSMEIDLHHLRKKTQAGADVIITQLFYDNRHYYSFVDACRALGITQPIVPGLMPIMNLDQISRLIGLCGASIPADLMRRLEQARPEEVPAIGVEHTTKQALELLERGVPGIHFYVLNQCFQISEILPRLRAVLS
jgi:methylenetetrahydrofolate reductase (NADPH)